MSPSTEISDAQLREGRGALLLLSNHRMTVLSTSPTKKDVCVWGWVEKRQDIIREVGLVEHQVHAAALFRITVTVE